MRYKVSKIDRSCDRDYNDIEEYYFDDWDDAYDQFCQLVFETQTETNESILIEDKMKSDKIMFANSENYSFKLEEIK